MKTELQKVKANLASYKYELKKARKKLRIVKDPLKAYEDVVKNKALEYKLKLRRQKEKWTAYGMLLGSAICSLIILLGYKAFYL